MTQFYLKQRKNSVIAKFWRQDFKASKIIARNNNSSFKYAWFIKENINGAAG